MASNADDVRIAVMELMENMAGLREAVSGYRKQCESDGFDAHHAQHMALELHGFLIDVMRANMPKPGA